MASTLCLTAKQVSEMHEPLLVEAQVVEVSLTNRKTGIIDAVDLPLIIGKKWHSVLCNKKWYVHSDRDGYMHRILLDAPKNRQVDHRDGDGLNNRRYNIRVCTITQNRQNTRNQENTKTGFKGVCFHRPTNSYGARIHVNHKKISLQYHPTAEAAARAYDAAALKYFGEFARLNFPIAAA